MIDIKIFFVVYVYLGLTLRLFKELFTFTHLRLLSNSKTVFVLVEMLPVQFMVRP